MTEVRTAALAAMMGSLPVVVWVSGMLAVNGTAGEGAGDIFSDALRGLFTVLGVIAAVFGIWCAPRFGWRNPGTAQIVLLTTPLPLFCLAWLAGVVPLQVLGNGLLLLALGSLLILGLGKAIVGIAPGRSFEKIALGALQLVLAGGVFITRDLWLGWIGI